MHTPDPPFKPRPHARTWKTDCGGGGGTHVSLYLFVSLPKVTTLNACHFMPFNSYLVYLAHLLGTGGWSWLIRAARF